MENTTLLRPTLHVEVLMKGKASAEVSRDVANDISGCLNLRYVSLQVNEVISGYGNTKHASMIESVVLVDYTGPPSDTDVFPICEAQLDIQTYSLRKDSESGGPRRRISQPGGAEDDVPQARVLPLPNVALKDEWSSLIYDDGLPAQLLRYLTRMLGVMKQPDLNLATFNWNRLCLLYGPPGSGKSTLSRALAQKLSIRLSATFPQAVLVEVNTNAMLSKYFGESGKLIGNLFEKIHGLAHSPTTLVCVVIDEVETIAGSRQKATDGGECSDGLRATNQLLTALDKIRVLPNIIVLCTSNLIDAIDPAFLDRVDIRKFIPTPSPAAIYNIFRSCLNELVRTRIISTAVEKAPSSATLSRSHSPPSSPSVPAKRRAFSRNHQIEAPLLPSKAKVSSLPVETPSPKQVSKEISLAWMEPEQPAIPSLLELKIMCHGQPESVGGRVWVLAEKCVGFSGRTLRRLPILGLAMYTWGGSCSLHDAITALDSAVNQELKARSE